MSNRILVLVDYKGELYCPHKRTAITTNLKSTARFFEEAGYVQTVQHFEDVDFRQESYKGVPVLYQSSQDGELYYKGYIEDILLGLYLSSAMLIPDFFKFRAHHNKVFQEVLRDIGALGISAKRLRSFSFGTYESFAKKAASLAYPVVLKPAAGDSSDNVYLVHNPKQALNAARRLSRTWSLNDVMTNLHFTMTRPGFQPASYHRGKIIAQEYVPDLDHDFKILAFGGRYFVEKRGVRAGDFRASGSSVTRVWPESLPVQILDSAEQLFKTCDVPYASIDILFDGKNAFLGEVQFLRFGTKPLVEAPHYWKRTSSEWKLIRGNYSWEEELVRAVVWFLKHRN
ncbi:MAG: hypothetical protein GY762_18850 [Proteobacteria bacterium]|nr:hypothetical protein [Pseudomonadota bacterium]